MVLMAASMFLWWACSLKSSWLLTGFCFWLGIYPAAFQARMVAFQSLIGCLLLVHPFPSHLFQNHSPSLTGNSISVQKS